MTPKCMLEVDELLYRAEKLARGSASEKAQARVLQQRARTLESRGFSSGEIRAKYAGALSDELGLNRKFDDADTAINSIAIFPATRKRSRFVIFWSVNKADWYRWEPRRLPGAERPHTDGVRGDEPSR